MTNPQHVDDPILFMDVKLDGKRRLESDSGSAGSRLSKRLRVSLECFVNAIGSTSDRLAVV
jgi:hypothetical protein